MGEQAASASASGSPGTPSPTRRSPRTRDVVRDRENHAISFRPVTTVVRAEHSTGQRHRSVGERRAGSVLGRPGPRVTSRPSRLYSILRRRQLASHETTPGHGHSDVRSRMSAATLSERGLLGRRPTVHRADARNALRRAIAPASSRTSRCRSLACGSRSRSHVATAIRQRSSSDRLGASRSFLLCAARRRRSSLATAHLLSESVSLSLAALLVAGVDLVRPMCRTGRA